MTNLVTETTPLGEPWAAAVTADQATIATQRDAAAAVLFPAELSPATSDAIAEYVFHTGRLGPRGYGEALAVLHHRSLAGHPALAALLRSREALDDIGAAASQTATPSHHLETHHAAGARAAREACTRYRAAIAQQIAAVNVHELAAAARQLLEAEALQARLLAACARHEAHAATELARVEAERRAAAAAVRDETVQRVLAAETAAREALLDAQRKAEAFRVIKAEAVIARLEQLRHAGRQSVRWGRDADEKVFAIEDLIATMRGGSLEQLNQIEIVLDRGAA